MTRPALAGHAFPRSLYAPTDAPYRCRCGLEVDADTIRTRPWADHPLCPMLGIVNTVEQMATPTPAPVVLDGQLSLFGSAA